MYVCCVVTCIHVSVLCVRLREGERVCVWWLFVILIQVLIKVLRFVWDEG